jgi:DNA-binding LacI/PurR family transcriptional regulator
MKQPSRHLTMQHIADELGLSRMTVSSVLNRRARERGYAKATEAKILSYLAQRGYVPSRHAVSLRGSGTEERVGILHCGRLYSHLIEAFNRLMARLVTGSHPLEIMVVEQAQRLEGLRELIARGVSRLVWFHTSPLSIEMADAAALLPYLGRLRRLVIYNYFFSSQPLDSRIASLGASLVGVDRDEGYGRLGRLLRELGHTTVVKPELVPSAAEGAQREAVAAMQAAGLTVIPGNDDRVPYEHGPRFGRAMAAAVLRLRRSHGVTAACFGDDEIAGYAMAELLRQGVRIPQDLTVTGYDGMLFAASYAVPLTTLAVPVDRMTDRVIELVQGANARVSRRFRLELVLRASHGPAPRARPRPRRRVA